MRRATLNEVFQAHKEFYAKVLPRLLEAGWTMDEDCPEVQGPIPSMPRIRLKFKDPSTGLYYSLKDAARILNGENPRREGFPKLTQRQKEAVLRHLLEPEAAKGFCEGLQGHNLALFPDFDEHRSGYLRAIEAFIEAEHEKIGR